jgi:VCBS repeat-containing protein
MARSGKSRGKHVRRRKAGRAEGCAVAVWLGLTVLTAPAVATAEPDNDPGASDAPAAQESADKSEPENTTSPVGGVDDESDSGPTESTEDLGADSESINDTDPEDDPEIGSDDQPEEPEVPPIEVAPEPADADSNKGSASPGEADDAPVVIERIIDDPTRTLSLEDDGLPAVFISASASRNNTPEPTAEPAHATLALAAMSAAPTAQLSTPVDALDPCRCDPSPLHIAVASFALVFFETLTNLVPFDPFVQLITSAFINRLNDYLHNESPTLSVPTMSGPPVPTTDGLMAITGSVTGSDGEGDGLVYAITTQGEHGTATIDADGNFIYLYSPGSYSGTDTFTITVSDATGSHAHEAGPDGHFARRGVTVTIPPTDSNTPPTDISNLYRSSSFDTVSGSVYATDPDGDPIFYEMNLDYAPAYGDLTLDEQTGFWKYTFDADAAHIAAATPGEEVDMFRIQAYDTSGAYAAIDVMVPIEPRNTPPDFTAYPGRTNADGTVTYRTRFNDADGDRPTYTIGNVQHGTVVDNLNGTFTYTPDHDHLSSQAGVPTDVFTVTVTDGHGGTTTGIAVYTHSVPGEPEVDPDNSAPLNISNLIRSANEHTVFGSVYATDPDGDPIIYEMNLDYAPIYGQLSLNEQTGFWNYTFDADTPHIAAVTPGEQVDTFRIHAYDPSGADAAIDITIPIPSRSQNSDPALHLVPGRMSPDNTVTFRTILTDDRGDVPTYTIGNTQHGTVIDNRNGTFTYTPDPDYLSIRTGIPTAVFDVTVADGRGGSTTATATYTANDEPINQPPTDLATTVREPNVDTGIVGGRVTAVDRADTVLYRAGTAASGSVVIDALTGNWHYTPTADARHAAAATTGTPVTTDSFTLTATDTVGSLITIEVEVAIAASNAAPTLIVSGPSTPASDGTVVYTAHFDDPDADLPAYSITATPAHGTVTMRSTGVFVYTPDRAYFNRQIGTAKDSFAVTATDGHGATVTALGQYTYASPTIEVAGRAIQDLVVSADGRHGFLLTYDDQPHLTVIDTVSNSARLVDLSYSGSIPTADPIANHDGSLAYLELPSFAGTNRVAVIDTDSATVTYLELGGARVSRALVTSGGRTELYQVAVSGGATRITAINIADGSVRRASVNRPPASPYDDLVFNADGSKAYLSTESGSGVQIVELDTSTFTGRTITVAAGEAASYLTLSADGSRAAVGTFTGTSFSHHIVTLETGAVTSVTLPSQGGYTTHLNQDGSRAYLILNGSVTVINTASRVMTQVSLGEQPDYDGVLMNPGGTRLYVPTQRDGGVTVINTGTGAVTRIPITGSYWFATLSPDGSRLLVAAITVEDTELTLVNAAAGTVIGRQTIPLNAISDPAESIFGAGSSLLLVRSRPAGTIAPPGIRHNRISMGTGTVVTATIDEYGSGPVNVTNDGLRSYLTTRTDISVPLDGMTTIHAFDLSTGELHATARVPGSGDGSLVFAPGAEYGYQVTVTGAGTTSTTTIHAIHTSILGPY